jgi:DNA-binding beta-propeller fold protein YncE
VKEVGYSATQVAPAGSSSGDFCEVCEAGSYGNSSGYCDVCPAGHTSLAGQDSKCDCKDPCGYQRIWDGSQCVTCAPGSVSPAAGGTNAGDGICDPASSCSANQYDASGTCTACPADTPYSPSGSTNECFCTADLCYYTPCPFNEYLDDSRNCIACPADTVSPNFKAALLGDSQCDTASSCLANQFALPDGSCVPCPFSKPYSLPGATSECYCEKCSIGLIEAEGECVAPCLFDAQIYNMNTQQCEFCPAGQYKSNPVTCSKCPLGTFNATVGAASLSDCTPCPAGSFGNATGAEECYLCSTGQYSSAGSSACSDCPGGSYSTQAAMTSVDGCLDCEANYYCTGGSARAFCGVNFVSPVNSDAFVDCVCDFDKYRDSGDNTVCQNCPARAVSDKDSYGLGACTTPCLRNEYFDTVTTNCVACPFGQYTSAGKAYSAADCTGGCGRDQYIDLSDLQCYSCPTGKFSEPGVATSQDDCTPCRPNYYGTQGDCTACPPGTTSIAGQALTRCDCTHRCGEGQSNATGSCQTCPLATPLSPAGTAARSDSGCDAASSCAANEYLDASSSCVACPAGTWSHPGSPSACYCRPIPCRVNEYVDTDNGHCLACPTGTFSLPATSRSIDDCIRGYELGGHVSVPFCRPGYYGDGVALIDFYTATQVATDNLGHALRIADTFYAYTDPTAGELLVHSLADNSLIYTITGLTNAKGFTFLDDFNNVLVATQHCLKHVRLSDQAVVETFGSCATSGTASGDPSTAKFNSPLDVWYNRKDSYAFVVDTNKLRKIDWATQATSDVASLTGIQCVTTDPDFVYGYVCVGNDVRRFTVAAASPTFSAFATVSSPKHLAFTKSGKSLLVAGGSTALRSIRMSDSYVFTLQTPQAYGFDVLYTDDQVYYLDSTPEVRSTYIDSCAWCPATGSVPEWPATKPCQCGGACGVNQRYDPTTSTCVACAANTYAPAGSPTYWQIVGVEQCDTLTICDANHYWDGLACAACPAGLVSLAGAPTDCYCKPNPCTVSYYFDGSTGACELCPDGTTSVAFQATSPDHCFRKSACEVGSYAEDSFSPCSPCPSGLPTEFGAIGLSSCGQLLDIIDTPPLCPIGYYSADGLQLDLTFTCGAGGNEACVAVGDSEIADNPASHALDSHLNTRFGSYAGTGNSWYVTLPAERLVQTVRTWSYSYLGNVADGQVWVGPSMDTHTENLRCGIRIRHVRDKSPRDTVCTRSGRYVWITQPEDRRLEFAEVRVYGECTPCPSGFTNAVAGSTSSVSCSVPVVTQPLCAANTYSSTGRGPVCTPCPDRYTSEEGAVSCRLSECPAGSEPSRVDLVWDVKTVGVIGDKTLYYNPPYMYALDDLDVIRLHEGTQALEVMQIRLPDGSRYRLKNPTNMVVSLDNSVMFVTEYDGNAIGRLALSLEGTALIGVYTTLAGYAGEIFYGSSLDDDVGLDARFSRPVQLALDVGGKNLFVCEKSPNRVRNVDLVTLQVTTLVALQETPWGIAATNDGEWLIIGTLTTTTYKFNLVTENLETLTLAHPMNQLATLPGQSEVIGSGYITSYIPSLDYLLDAQRTIIGNGVASTQDAMFGSDASVFGVIGVAVTHDGMSLWFQQSNKQLRKATLNACPLCKPGQSSSGSNAACQDCPAGSFANTSGFSACLQCPHDSYQDTPGSTHCVSCAQGYYTLAAGSSSASSCTPICPANHYGTLGECYTCPPYTTSPPGSPSRCNCTHSCGRGFKPTSVGCAACPTSSPMSPSFKAALDNSGCDVKYTCAENEYGDASEICERCPMGTWSKAGAATECYCEPIPCKHNEYMDTTISVCRTCPLNTFSPSGRARSVNDCHAKSACAAGEYLDALDACMPCPDGTESIEGSVGIEFCQPAENILGDYFRGDREYTYAPCPDGLISEPLNAGDASACTTPLFCPNGTYGDAEVTDAWGITTLAGDGTAGFRDGHRGFARFNTPYNLISAEHYVLVADGNNHAIRKVDIHSGFTQTLAGTGVAGYLDGPGSSAQFRSPIDVVIDRLEAFAYVADEGNNCVRRIDLVTSAVIEYAGDCTPAATTSSVSSTRSLTRFNRPKGLALDDAGEWLVVVDIDNLRKINLGDGSVASIVSVPAGSPSMVPAGLDLVGDLAYVACKSHHSIRRVNWRTPGACVDFVGSGDDALVDGIGTEASFWDPTGVAIDWAGRHLLVADSQDHSIRYVNLDTAQVSTLAGSTTPGRTDSNDSIAAQFYTPWGVALNRDGKLAIVSDQSNHQLRRMRVDGCLDCPPGFTSVNGSRSAWYCQRSLCPVRPDYMNNDLSNMVDFHVQRVSRIDEYEGRLAFWLDAGNLDRVHNRFAHLVNDAVLEWANLAPGARVMTPVDAPCYHLVDVGVYFTGHCGYDLPLDTANAGKLTVLMVLNRFEVAAYPTTVFEILNTHDAMTSRLVFHAADELRFLASDGTASPDYLSLKHDLVNTALHKHDILVWIRASGAYVEMGVNGIYGSSKTLAHQVGVNGVGGKLRIGASADSDALNKRHHGYIKELIGLNDTLPDDQLHAASYSLSRKWAMSGRWMDSDGDGVRDSADLQPYGENLKRCWLCPSGSQPLLPSGVCSACPYDKYSFDGDLCRYCPSNSSAPRGSTRLSACVCNDGYYQLGDRCAPCPEGYFCQRVCPSY